MRVYALTLAYNGKNYCGWQVQKNGVSVQKTVQNAIEKVFGESIDLCGCSRTDSGVHANGYVCHFKTEKFIDPQRLPLALNTELPRDICVKQADLMDEEFHARYSAKGKEYVYLVWNSRIRNPFTEGLAWQYPFEINVEEANLLAKKFVGKKDFCSFMSAGSKITDTVREVFDFKVERDGETVKFTVSADGFLYNMVRIMVGTVLKALNGNLCVDNVIDAKSRSAAGPTAPPEGLYLNRVFY
ncbi:MAG: tRNA pseudouridine(38-40) synthase TruA [Clostridia bacterium]|nr:tRNA pseudouridine(38-40) synthase TruA [Clostridia bacterium]